MKQILFVFILGISSLSVSAQCIENSGVILGGGGGIVTSDLPGSYSGLSIDREHSSLEGKAAVSLGYRVRFSSRKSRLYFDTDILTGYGKTEYRVNFLSNGSESYGGGAGDRIHFYAGLAGTCNFRIVKGLSIGLGFQPTFYIWEDRKFDVPAIGKLSYDFKFAEVAFSYKQGLVKYRDFAAFRNVRLSNWEFSLYVPLKRKK